MRGVAGILPIRRRRDLRTAERPVARASAGERPYPDIPAGQVAAYRFAAAAETAPLPSYYPATGTAPKTAPEPVIIPGAVPAVAVDMPEVLRLRRLRDGLLGISWAALDAARQQGATHAAMRRARGQAPFGDYMDRTFIHPASRHPQRGELNRARVDALTYPEYGRIADDSAYAPLMRRLNQITGTQGWTPRRAITSGSSW
jgi:hypothetical protein